MSKNKLVYIKRQVIRRLAYQKMILDQILQKLELYDHMCIFDCKNLEEKPKQGR